MTDDWQHQRPVSSRLRGTEMLSAAGSSTQPLVSDEACNSYCVVGAGVKANRGRIQLNCGPVSSTRTIDTSCPEYLVRHLFTSFVHVLRGVLFYCPSLCNFVSQLSCFGMYLVGVWIVPYLVSACVSAHFVQNYADDIRPYPWPITSVLPRHLFTDRLHSLSFSASP